MSGTASTIPASEFVQLTPSVISGGGNALDLNGVIFTTNTRVPMGAVYSFAGTSAVSSFFGPTATETTLAGVYFNGFDTSTAKPGNLFFVQYPWTSPVAAYLRGGNISGLSLTALQALSGVLTITIDGTPVTSATINLSSATSFSNAATLIETGLAGGTTVTYDSVSGAFVVATTSTGSTATIGFASGSLSAGLLLTQATGAVTSQGSEITTPAAALNAVVAVTTNWATFTTTFEPVTADKEAFALWTSQQNNRYLYSMWDSNILNTEAGGGSPAVAAINLAGYSGVAMQYANSALDTIGMIGVLPMGFIASLDFTRTQGRSTMAFKSQAGFTPQVTNQTAFNYLKSYNMNCYLEAATANQGFQFFSPGAVVGPFKWIDSYVNQIWMNNQFQLALMGLLTAMNSIPYNAAGYALIEAACADVINQALNFGAIQPGVPLSAAQAAEVNAAAGLQIDGILSTRGWYLQVLPATAQVRAARGTPPITFWYTDGGSVQTINLASIEIQ